MSTTDMNANQLPYALDALRRGFCVFPCKPRDKKPAGDLAPNGVKEATTSEDQVRQWWQQNPEANPGITGGIIVDCDAGLNSAEEARNFMRLAGLPETFAVRTGRRDSFGVQFHFTGSVENSRFELNGVRGEIRCHNQYGMAPGSIHPISGERYEVFIDAPRAAFPTASRLVRERKKIEKPQPGEKVAQERNNWLASQAGRLVNVGLSGKALEVTILELNRQHCVPPLRVGVVRSTVLKSAPNFEQKKSDDFSQDLEVERADNVKVERAGWLWQEKIPRHAVTLFAGNPDVGKTTVALDIAARITTMQPMPKSDHWLSAGSVVILSAEDDPAVDLVPRLTAANANLSRVYFIKAVSSKQKERKSERLFRLDTDIEQLKRKMRIRDGINGASLIIIDPISAYFGAKKVNSTQEARDVLTPLTKLCQEYKVSIIGIEHFSKRTDVGAIHKTGGSVALTAAARAVFMFSKDPDHEGHYRMDFIKGNRSRNKCGIAYAFGERQIDGLGGQPYIIWGDEVQSSADEVLARTEEKRKENRKDRAASWLREYLAGGQEVESEKLLADAQQRGISRSACYEAKGEVGVKAKQRDRKWYWFVPVTDEPREASLKF